MKKIFIKNRMVQKDFDDKFFSPAVRFRRTFYIDKVEKALLSVCGLGYGYYYINGKKVSEDLLTAPVSDYDKTLWYNVYDVTHLLQAGKNVLCAHLGNGFYNENFDTPWKHNEAHWRDTPKLCVEFQCGDLLINADETFRTSIDKATYYNQLRIGEFCDSVFEDDWLDAEYDDRLWEMANIDENMPKGVLRECIAPPIRERKEYPCVEILQNDKGYVFDFGQNFSGYVRLKVIQPMGTVLTLEYAEDIDEKNNLKLNGLDLYYKPFQIDKLTCNGKKLVWSPKFTYHGFRYVQISGLTSPISKEDIVGVFVCQEVQRTSEFECSLPLLNQIYNAGIISTLSNMHYTLTDCPTREKLGWLNDAAASAEQIWLNFDVKEFMRKFAVDLCDAVENDGSAYGIVPTNGCQHNLGPITDAFYYMLVYYQYLHYQDEETIRQILPYCLQNLKYLIKQVKDGYDFVLADWNGSENKPTPKDLIFALSIVEFIDKLQFVLKGVNGQTDEKFEKYKRECLEFVADKYVNDGKCTVEEQTACAMLIWFGLGDKQKLGEQLEKIIVEKDNTHLNVGMIGLRFIFDALAMVGKHDLVIEMISQPTSPSYAKWFNEGATTLWESFEKTPTLSKNHHLFSSVLAWIIKYVLGVRLQENGEIAVKPLKFEKISTVKGKIKAFGENLEIYIENGNATVKKV